LWTHWLVWNIPPNTTDIPEGRLPPGAREGKNSFGDARYDGPAPPSGTHRYFFHLYALDLPFFPKFRTASDRDAMLAGMEGHIVGKAETFGIYSASP
jgi:Raf kinase inhibitor-like YbhB/YbcL family protein